MDGRQSLEKTKSLDDIYRSSGTSGGTERLQQHREADNRYQAAWQHNPCAIKLEDISTMCSQH